MSNIRSLRFEDISSHNFLRTRPFLTLFAGENGSGKSRALRALAIEDLASGGRVLAISSSAYHRFNALGPNSKVLAPRRTGSAPEAVLKDAIREAQNNDQIRLRLISRVLRHCNYSPTIGLKVEISMSQGVARLREEIQRKAKQRGRSAEDLESAIFILNSIDAERIAWLSFDGLTFDVSLESNFLRVLFWERELTDLGLIRSIRLFLRAVDRTIELREASSGELALITSLSFIAANASKFDLVLIDEPENSLHPQWQRDYVELLVAAVGYVDSRVVIATHSPLLVIGMETAEVGAEICVLSQVMHDLHVVEGVGLEEVMAKVFMTITPKSHFLSQELVGVLDRLEEKRIGLQGAVAELELLKAGGLDSQQEVALELVKRMALSIAEDRP